MIESMLEDKSDFDKFIKILHDHELAIEDKVKSEGSDELDTLMMTYRGRISSEDLTMIQLAFRAEKVSVGGDYIAVTLPPEMHEEASW